MPAIAVFVRFLGGGFKYPLRAGDTLEIWSDRHELCGTVDAAMLLDLLAVYLRSADLTKRLADAVTGPVTVERTTFHLPEPPDRKPLAPPLRGTFPPERQAALRAKRRARRKTMRRTARMRGGSMNAGLTVEGGIKFHLEVAIEPHEMASWGPERIHAFFEGLTLVMLARNAREAMENFERSRDEIGRIIADLTAKIEIARGLNPELVQSPADQIASALCGE